MAREWNRVPQLSLFCLLVLPLGRRRSTVLRGMPTPHTLFGQGLARPHAKRACASFAAYRGADQVKRLSKETK